MYKNILVVYLLSSLCGITLASYSCQTVLDDLENEGNNTDDASWGLGGFNEFKFFHKKKPVRTNWPEAKVKYQVDKTMTLSETAELLSALEEFHTKTCVKFELKTNTKKEPYVSIERSSNVQCGEASYCKSGNNYARFNTSCMTKNSFIHQLGHSICLGHENQRWDRDQFVSYDYCDNKPGKMKFKNDSGIYDYSSQMHFSCGEKNCLGGTPPNSISTACGEDAHSGLSVLDADKINQRYNCQACHRHRWVPINLLKEKDKENMYSFGNVDYLGREIFPCRAFHFGEVAVGMYTHEEETCWIPSKRTNTSEGVKNLVELLIIPGGLCATCSRSYMTNEHIFQYELASNLGEGSVENLLKDGVPGGSLILGYQEYFVGYIAFGTVSSKYFGKSEEDKNDENEVFGVDVIGTAWNENGGLESAIFATGKEYPVDINNFKVLICK